MLFWLTETSGVGPLSLTTRQRVQPALETQPQARYWPQLDGFRTMCVLMVFIIHAWINPGTKPSPIGAFGYLGVDAFFTLSAFLITSLLIQEKSTFGDISYRNFVVRRGLRIWPLFYAVVFFTCVFLPLLNLPAALPLYGEFAVKQFLPAALFCFNFSYPFNNKELADFSIALGIPVIAGLVPFWTLCMEEHFYAVWPLVLKKVRTLNALLFGIGIAEIFTVALRCVFHWLSVNTIHVEVPFQLYFMNTLCHLDPLLVGAFLAIMYHQHPQWFNRNTKQMLPVVGITIGALAYLFSNMYLHFPVSSPMMIFDMTATAVASGLMLYVVMAWQPIRELFSSKKMAEIGRVSFAIYLLHNFVLAVIEKPLAYLPLPDVQYSYFAIKCLIGFPITYCLALLSWKYLEGPCHRLKKRFQRKQANLAA
ncbi:MAG: hypothetical protein C0507_06280 [Cyanobacteria bacterium PR.3.49]|nr:hypothetical protein [Cyanobacteria bacterium PR.3.49]